MKKAIGLKKIEERYSKMKKHKLDTYFIKTI